jgi:hypothetical protein
MSNITHAADCGNTVPPIPATPCNGKGGANKPDTYPQVIDLLPRDRPTDAVSGDDLCWTVERQDLIEVMGVRDGSIEIIQRSPLGEDDDECVTVASRNVVALARRILWAAGFNAVLIATGGRGGYSDLADGSVPEDFAGNAEAVTQ